LEGTSVGLTHVIKRNLLSAANDSSFQTWVMSPCPRVSSTSGKLKNDVSWYC